MSLQTFQKDIFDFVVCTYKKYFPNGGESETIFQEGWFEETYTFEKNILGKNIPIQVYTHIDIWDRGVDSQGNQLYAILGQMGFRVPYQRTIWEKKPREVVSFTIKPDAQYSDLLNFSYNGSHGNKANDGVIPFTGNIGITIEQFAADVVANLDGMYQLLIADYNGYGPGLL